MRIPPLLVPIVAIGALLAGVLFAFRLPFPTYILDFERGLNSQSGKRARVDLIVQNLRCRSRSAMLGRYLQPDPGILRLETYVGEMRARVVFDPQQTSVASISRLTETVTEVPAKPSSMTAELSDAPLPSSVKRVRVFTIRQVAEVVGN